MEEEKGFDKKLSAGQKSQKQKDKRESSVINSFGNGASRECSVVLNNIGYSLQLFGVF